MPTMYFVSMALFAALLINDFVMIRKVQKSLRGGRFELASFTPSTFGGSPTGMLVNLYRLRQLPCVSDLSDPDLKVIRLHYRAQQTFAVLLLASLVVSLALGSAA